MATEIARPTHRADIPYGARNPVRVVTGELVREGAGVRNIVTLGGRELRDLDPFLLLAEFGGEEPADYIGGFPLHPHRGFETLTSVLEGQLKHSDSRGNSGRLGPGAVQRMKAARGLLHSEMADQTEGPLRALQLWINLPARDKMDEPGYQDVAADRIPRFERGGVSGRVIVGPVFGLESPIEGCATELHFLDLALAPRSGLDVPLPPAHAAVAYGLGGRALIDGYGLAAASLIVLSPRSYVRIAADEASRLVLLSARPIGEPVARQGPFVMNTDAEIREAFADLRSGRFGAVSKDESQ